jgi:ATPase subunit of ABC transporter with duplicated ATPase domains
VIVARDVSVAVGARTLLEPTSFQIASGDRIGLVGRNGAGKTTLTKILAGEGAPASGQVTNSGLLGYLPQDPRTGDPEQTARDRILSARGLDGILQRLATTSQAIADASEDEARDDAMRRYSRAEAELAAAGGYAAESEASRISANLGLPDRVLAQAVRTLSGGQRRRVELARILFSGADTLLLDEPTNHLDADSIVVAARLLGLLPGRHPRDQPRHRPAGRRGHEGLPPGRQPRRDGPVQPRLEEVPGSARDRREAPRASAPTPRRRRRACWSRPRSWGPRPPRRSLPRTWPSAPSACSSATEGQRAADRVAKIRFPDPAPSGRVPLTAEGLSKSYGSLEVFTGVDLAIDRGANVVVLGLNGAGKTTLLRILAGIEEPDTGEVVPGHGLKLGYYAQEHETIDVWAARCWTTWSRRRRTWTTPRFARSLVVPVHGDDVDKPAKVLSGGEKTRLALAMLVVSAANVLLLDEPTNNLDPASRAEVLDAIRTYAGAVVLVTHDEGAVDALQPDRVLLLPDGDEDLWSPEYSDLISLA